MGRMVWTIRKIIYLLVEERPEGTVCFLLVRGKRRELTTSLVCIQGPLHLGGVVHVDRPDPHHLDGRGHQLAQRQHAKLAGALGLSMLPPPIVWLKCSK